MRPNPSLHLTFASRLRRLSPAGELKLWEDEVDVSRDVPQSIDDAFFAGTRSAEMPFVVNDDVRVVSGQYEGRSGAVISIERMCPTMLVLVEMGDGLEIVFDVSALTREPAVG